MPDLDEADSHHEELEQMAEQSILVNGAQSVGKIIVDESSIRGEGGPARPQLAISAVISMSHTGVITESRR
jgi:hypothetical protein